MENNLFLALRKYRPREGNDPLENYVTAAFGWILKNHPEYSTFILSNVHQLVQCSFQFENPAWSTQVYFDGIYPDMVCEFDNHNALVFENKVWSALHLNQLNNYRAHAQHHYREYRLILITAICSQHTQNADLAICWKDVFRWTEKWIKEKEVESADTHNVFQDFVNMLGYLGLGHYPLVQGRLNKRLLVGIMNQIPEALLELNELAEQGLICKTDTKKQNSEDLEAAYRLRDFYYDIEIGLRGEWKSIPRPCLRWKNAKRGVKNEWLNLDNLNELNKNLAVFERM